MRPYKKRSFFNQHNHDSAAEMDNSDETEVQVLLNITILISTSLFHIDWKIAFNKPHVVIS